MSKKLGILLLAFVIILVFVAAPSFVLAEEKPKRDIVIVPFEYRAYALDKTTLETFEEVDEQGIYYPYNWWYRFSNALFLYTHPDIWIDFEKSYESWPQGTSWEKEALMTAFAAGDELAFLELGCMTGSPEEEIAAGYAADITDLVKEWKSYDHLRENMWPLWQRAWRNDRCYAIPYIVATSGNGFTYRKDLFKEAGIFNEEGKAGPSSNWTLTDFKDICLKVTDPKKEIWALAVAKETPTMIYDVINAYGAPLVIPDKSGEFTWKCGLNLPESRPVLEFFQDLANSGSMLIRPLTKDTLGVREDFPAGRVAMAYWDNIDGAVQRGVMSKFDPTIFEIAGVGSFYENCGVAPVPLGPEGVRVSAVDGYFYAVNPILDEEHKKAAFELMTWYFGGGPAWALNIQMLGIMKGYANPVQEYVSPYPFPPGTLTMSESVPGWDKIGDIIRGFPAAPTPAAYNLLANLGVVNYMPISSTWPLFTQIFTNPEIDLQRVVDEEVKRIDRGVLDYKAEGQTVEDYKEYYTALDAFYKENFPQYYEKTFKKLWEKYYQVW